MNEHPNPPKPMSDSALREEGIFSMARQLSHPQDRAAYLEDACGDNKVLRERIEHLLQAEQHANEFLANDPFGLNALLLSPTGEGDGVKGGEGPGSVVDRYDLPRKAREQADKSACDAGDRSGKCVPMTPVAPVPGDVIEDYEILEKIGGNMGLVFKARQRLLDKVVALKVLPADSIAEPARLARFQRELRVMGQLEHPNLVTATDARIVGDWHLVAMELIEGMDLQRLVETRGPLPVAEACEVARQAALGLQHAHEHGLIHRDIKPSNLMLTSAGTVKVIDMGLALTKREPKVELTQKGFVLGTMNYCAPEQFRDASRVDIRADIYSLGCTLYHLLAGNPPYWQRTTFGEVVEAHLNEGFPSLVEVRPGAPPGLERVLARMTAKDPGSRFGTPAEVAEALGPFARGGDLKHFLSARIPQVSISPTGDKWLEVESRKPEKDAVVPVAEVVHVRKPRRPAMSGEHRRRARRKYMAAAVLVLLVAIAGAALLVMKPWEGDPIVVLMDTTAGGGVYDPENLADGKTNAEEIKKDLRGLLPDNSLLPEPMSSEWKGEASVLGRHPRLVVIHRSAFFHALNAKFKFGNPADAEKWKALYDAADDKLIVFIGFVGTGEPSAKFLVYSRGTDTNWWRLSFQRQWIKEVEERFPKLRGGRITTMVIPGGTNATFRDPETRVLIRTEVKKILGLSEKRD